MDKQDEQVAYKKGIVYQIVDDETGETYIGSTFQKLEQRMIQHRCKNNKCISKKIIDRGNYSYNILLKCKVPNKIELHKLERHYIETTPNVINKYMPYVSEEEKKQKQKVYKKHYKENNKEHITEYAKQYYAKNIIIIKRYYNSFPKTKCPCGGAYTSNSNKNKHFKTKKHMAYEESLNSELDIDPEDIKPYEDNYF